MAETRDPIIASKDALLGVILAGARLEEVIGEGAAARVYRATRLADGRPFAVKVLTDHRRRGLLERFRREARALRRICHPNVVAVFDSGSTPDGRPYLMMELLNGQTVAKLLEVQGSLPGTRVKALALQISAGLAAAHERGLVHRDLKPSNLMLVSGHHGERIKILDFGVVRSSDVGAATALTKSEVLLGTPRYMSPEQVMSPNQAGPSTDLYALGVILYELLSGRAPFTGQVVELIDQHLHHAPPPLLTQTGLEPLVRSLLEKDPAARPPSAALLHDLLEELIVVDGPAPSLSLLGRAVGRRAPMPRRDPGVVLRRNEQAHEDRTLRDGEIVAEVSPLPSASSLETHHDGHPTLLAEPATLFPATAHDESRTALGEPTINESTLADDEPAPTRIVSPEPRLPVVLQPVLGGTPSAPVVAWSRPWRPNALQISLLFLACFLVSVLFGYAGSF